MESSAQSTSRSMNEETSLDDGNSSNRSNSVGNTRSSNLLRGWANALLTKLPSIELGSSPMSERLASSSSSSEERHARSLEAVETTMASGAIARRPITLGVNDDSDVGVVVTRRCVCGHVVAEDAHCHFCLSKINRAKKNKQQSSFDASRLLRSRRPRQTRRAVSEDQRSQLANNSDGQSTSESTATSSSATTASSSFDRPSNPSLRRQERLLEQLPSPMESASGPFLRVPSNDHGLRSPPAPPSSTASLARRRQPQRRLALSHQTAHDLPDHSLPAATLIRAHTDPTDLSPAQDVSNEDDTHFNNETSNIPSSPPPAYSDVIRSSHPYRSSSTTTQPLNAPPSYEEALHTSSLSSSAPPSGRRWWSWTRSSRTQSEERASTRASRASRRRQLTREVRVEDIPDAYWEQAARELDFCTCRRCQARYRHYFEEDVDAMGDAMIPMETQMLMQEVFTDGMAFCVIS